MTPHDLPGDQESLMPIPTDGAIETELRCSCGSIGLRHEPPLVICLGCGKSGLRAEFVLDCALCGETFSDKKLRTRKAEKHEVCLGCADNEKLELTPDESNELAEAYWTSREAMGSHYSSELMAAARRIGH